MDDTTTVTYAKLFPGQVADKCSPYALESNTGPLAYLHALYAQVQSLEASGDENQKITLASRRPDIGERVLGQGSLDNQICALPLAIEAMTRQAKAYLGKEKNLAQAISDSIYPAQLPFHYALETIKAVIGHKGSSLFNLLQQLEYSFPSFSYDHLRTKELRSVMRKAAGFNPALQSLLLDKSAPTGASFLGGRYGLTSSGNDALKQLSDAEYFCSQTGLATGDIFDLLAVASVAEDAKSGVTAVKQSVHVKSGADAAAMAGHGFGAVFINNAKQPALSLEDALLGEGISLQIKGATADHFGRIHKIIHLKHALKLPYDQVDTLVMAALRAEGQTKDFHITENTLRALGVYQHLHTEYGVTAEQFAALIGGVTPYAVGENRPFLDRVLDGPDTGQLADIDAALMIDGREFILDPPADRESQSVTKSITGYICRAFAIDELSAKNYLLQITKALNLKAPALTLPVISSLYRLTRLPRLLRLGMVEGNCLIALLANVSPQVLSQLAGQPIISNDDEKPDILDVLIGMTNLEKWVREQKITACTLLGWMTPLPTDIPDALKALYGVDALTRRVVLDAITRLKSTLISESKIAEGAGANVSIGTDAWLHALQTYVDSKGLVKVDLAVSTQSLVQNLKADLNGKLRSSSGPNLPESVVREVAGRLEAIFRNAAIAQEDIAKHLLSAAFSHPGDGMKFTSEQAMPLLLWTNETPFSLLMNVLSCEDTLQTQTEESLQGLDIALWNKLARHAGVLKALRMSGAGLTAMLDHPRWFDLKDEDATDNSSAPPALTLDLCYQISCYRDWVQTCQRNGYEEVDALNYLARASNSDRPNAPTEAAQRLAQLIGWSSSEILLGSPYLMVPKRTSSNEPKTFDDFLETTSPAERSYYNYCERTTPSGGLGTLLHRYLKNLRHPTDTAAQLIFDRFKVFIEETKGSMKVSAEQYLPTTKPSVWERISRPNPATGSRPVTLQIYSPPPLAPVIEYEKVRCIPNTIRNIDLILRKQAQCSLTGLSCQSTFDLSMLDHESGYEDYQTGGQLLLAACNESVLSQLEPELQERWRDALSAYLMGYWVPSNSAAKKSIFSADDLSSYFLTDVYVSASVKTTVAVQLTSSLQHYLHRIFARLETGYQYAKIPEESQDFWRQYLNEYGSWKRWRTQLNHPENLIYYANRPNKSAAFQELEVELNQGKLDTELLQTAITSYLTKFEKTSNLQIVSGYLDGVDPKNDTYHFIGKTNTSPAEYYWRSLDMGLRDDKERLSPLAWSEWDKIGLSAGGQIVQSTYIDPTTKAEVKCDAVRPVVIEGRSYVFWVERGTTGLPSADEKNQTPTQFKKLSVQYSYQQSDGFWSPPNELLCLDGTKDSKRLPDAGNPYLKNDTYVPGLIALVNTEGARADDPWLTVMLYNCAYKADPKNKGIKTTERLGVPEEDYFIECRDLLLLDKIKLEDSDKTKIAKVMHNSYGDISKTQHIYTGDTFESKSPSSEICVSQYALEPYKKGALATPILYLFTPTQRNTSSESVNNGNSHPLLDQIPSITSDDIPKVIRFVSNNLPILVDIKIIDATNKLIYYNARYQTIILNLGKIRTIKTSKLNFTGTLDGENYSIIHQGTEAPLHWFELHEIPLKITTRSKLTPTIKYSTITKHTNKVAYGNELTPTPTPAPTASGETSHTFKLPVQPEALLEDSFRINVFIGETLLASLPFNATLNPEAYEKIELRLYVKGPKDQVFTRLTEESVVADGQAIITKKHKWDESGQYIFALCEAGNPLRNIFTTIDIRSLGLDAKWDISIKRNSEQAQYLDLSSVADFAPLLPSNAIRLNTLFGKQLVSRAARSVERALEWDAQLIKEPTIDASNPTPPVDFHGANGGYFRELFLHLPDLVATRLSEQQQFDEAEHWYTQYLFDPYRTQQDDKQRPPLWNTRPLSQSGTSSSTLQKEVDPIARAFTLSQHYRQAVFLALLDNWQRQGDHFYRQLTPSSLNHAWLCYQKALKLLGPLPERSAVSRWTPVTLQEIKPWSFRAPINERVIHARKTLEHRLYTLRHGLTLDGKALPDVDWRDEGVDPFSFAQRGIGQLVTRYNSDRAQIPAYRFRQLIPMARTAVQQLQNMGRHYMKLLEDEDNAEAEMMLLQQEIRMSDFTLTLQQQAISSVNAKKRVLEKGRQAALSRKEFYADLVQVGRSPMEEAAAGLIWSSVVLKSTSVPFQISAGITEGLIPTIYGVAFGGNQPSAPMAKAALVMESLAEASMFTSEQVLLESEYERRAQEWRFDLSQTEFDLSIIDLELDETDIELNAALISLDEARAARSNLEDLHADMNSGFTILPTYNWLVARQELLYGPAYDAVLSLCLSAEAAWRYEIGDYNRSAFIKTSAWSDSYKGMLAAESLLVDLQEMENAYLQCNERRLTIKKTINVKDTMTDSEWLKKITNLASAPLEFDFKSADFDRSYPGHYLRQLKHVSVSFVMEPGASASPEISAILTQTDSSTLVEPDFAGAQYLYQPDTKPPSSVKRNLRVQQQIALSSRVADDGLGFGQDDWVYELMFHDGRYLPFEGTGAVSRWQLSFPGGDFVKTLLTADSKATQVKTIQIHLVYTAVDGGQEFADQVKGLMKSGK